MYFLNYISICTFVALYPTISPSSYDNKTSTLYCVDLQLSSVKGHMYPTSNPNENTYIVKSMSEWYLKSISPNCISKVYSWVYHKCEIYMYIAPKECSVVHTICRIDIKYSIQLEINESGYYYETKDWPEKRNCVCHLQPMFPHFPTLPCIYPFLFFAELLYFP